MGIVTFSLTGLAAVGSSTASASYETAPYQVVRNDGKFELRDYPALVVVETPMGGANNSFMRLFRFIGGNNAARQKIAMTTPVLMAGQATNATMAFVMPQNTSASQVPKPTDPGVVVRVIAGGQFAVFRFSGGRNVSNETNALAKLESWLDREKLKQESGPMFGYFDPPWTLWFLRRNEVMLRVASAAP